MIYSRKGRSCFFLFFTSPVATFFHYFAQNVRATPNLRKKGGERRRASKKQFYYSKTPCEKKVPRRRALSSEYSSPWKMTHVEDSFFVHFHHTILAAALQGQQRTNISLLCALFSPEVFDKNCSIVLSFLTTDYYDAILILTFDTHKLIISGGILYGIRHPPPRGRQLSATQQCSGMMWSRRQLPRRKKGAWHVDMVNILWIKRKNHLHFAMQMAKSVEVAGFEPAAFWSRTKRATKLRYTSKKRANRGTRTLDLRFTKPLLYRLSHVGTAETIQLY